MRMSTVLNCAACRGSRDTTAFRMAYWCHANRNAGVRCHSSIPQKASEAGQLGSAIAHEVNQPLAAAANYAKIAQVAASRGPMTAEVGDALDSALQQIFRAADVLKGLRRFVQRGPLQPFRVFAGDVVGDGLGVLIVARGLDRLVFEELGRVIDRARREVEH